MNLFSTFSLDQASNPLYIHPPETSLAWFENRLITHVVIKLYAYEQMHSKIRLQARAGHCITALL